MFVEWINNILYVIQFIIVGSCCFRMKLRIDITRIILLVVSLFVLTVAELHIDKVIIETPVMLLYLFGVMCLVYNEKKRFLAMYIIAMVAMFSLLNLMTDMIVLSVVDIINDEVSKNAIHDMFSAGISLLFLALVGILVRCNFNKGIRVLTWKSMIIFSLLLVVDSWVALAMGAFAVTEYEKNTLYKIMYILVVIGIFIQLAMVIWFMLSREVYREKELITKKYLEEQVQHYSYLENRERETKKFRHDIRQHIHMLAILYQQEDYEMVDEYISEIKGKIDQFEKRISVDNEIADAIINKYYKKAEKKNIILRVKGRFPSRCMISAYDLCTILSNLLDNAICAEKECAGTEILMECRYTDTDVMIAIENDYDKIVRDQRGKLKTSKRNINNHGFGLENVAECVKKNRGDMNIRAENGKFRVLLNLRNNNG